MLGERGNKVATLMSPEPSQQSGWVRGAILGGIALVGIAGCAGMYYALGLWEQGRRETDFRLQVQQRFHTLEKHVRSTLEAVESVAAFFRASQYVEPEEFKTFTRPLLASHPGLHEVGWAGPKEFKIHYLEASQPAFLKPGMDVRSLPGGDRILRQLRSGSAEAAIGPILSEAAPPGSRGTFFICVSVRPPTSSANNSAGSSPSGRRGLGPEKTSEAAHGIPTPSDTSEGVVFGIFQPNVLMEQALGDLPRVGIDLYWYEGEAEENGRLISSWSGEAEHGGIGPLSETKWGSRLHESRPMELWGQPWRLYGVPTAAFLAERSSRAPELMFTVGLSGLCVLLAYIHVFLSRHAQVADLVQRRTLELQKARDDLAVRERSLRDSQVLYSSLVEGLPIAILRKNPQGRFIFANQAFCRLLKRPLEEVLGKTDFDFYPADLAEKYQADDRRVMETGQFLEIVEENVQNGERKYVQVMKFPVRDAAGQIVGVQVIFWDITDRRRAEMALEKERLLLQTLMDQLPHNIYFKDHQSRFIRINRALARYFDLSHPSQAEGKTDFDFFTPEHAEQALADEQYILATGRPILNKEEKETWPDGRVTWVSTTKLPLYDADGRIIGTYGISQDITEQKLAAEALKAAKEAAEAANQAKSQFLANVSHEIRTPLHALLGLTELVLDGPMDSAQRSYVEMIRDAGENLLMVLNDLLDFSKIEAGRLELENIPFGLRELVGETLKNLAFLAHGKGLDLVWFVAPETPEILLGDPLRVRQILSNLIGNAIKFTDRGEITLQVDCLDRQADSVQLHFQIRDTGVGIPPEKLETIFEMFEQADKSTTRKYGGTGLGLAICSRLVASMDGRLWAESQLGQGSCFHFTARFGLPSQPEACPTADQRALLQHRRILLLEPHPLERKNLEGLLRGWGMEPISAGSIAEAKAYAETAALSGGEGFDLVLAASTWPEPEKSQLVDLLVQEAAARCCLIWMVPAGCPCGEIGLGRPCREVTLIKPYKPSELLHLLLWAVADQNGPPPPLKRPEPFSTPLLPPLRILVAEDSPVGQQLAVGLLERCGHQVTVVRTGREAVDAVQRQPFDLLLMDLHMPEMDGWEAAQAIRSWEKQTGGHLPIIALTAHELSEELAKAHASGMDHYIGKPLRAQRLFQAMGEVFQKTQSVSPTQDGKSFQPENESSPGMIDWDGARRAVRGDDHLLQSVVHTLLQEAPQLQQTLRQAFIQQDARRLRLVAHTLKGSVRIFGRTPVYEEAWAIEQLAMRGSLPSQESLERLEESLRQLLDELKRRFAGSSSEGSSDA